MEEDRDIGFNGAPPPQRPPHKVSLTPFTPSASPTPRRLSSHFMAPSRPLRISRQLAWVSLQGRLVGADEATSAEAIGGGLSPQHAVAWDLFSPIQRVLVVAVIAVAAANSNKNKQIYRLTKSVELRDQILLAMQQKLDSLCEQLNSIKDQPGASADKSINKNDEFVLSKQPLAASRSELFECGCQLCNHHHDQPQLTDPVGNSLLRDQSINEVPNFKYSISNAVEVEERRMSDLSDWNSSVTSSVDIQMNSLVFEQDIDDLKNKCAEKDATLRELSTLLHSSDFSGSKRIATMEDIIRRKNMRITRLKKDMMVLEQKVLHLTRLMRSSSSSMKKLPPMVDNVLYDMKSTTPSPSTSDSDCPSRNRRQNSVPKTLGNSFAKDSCPLTKPMEKRQQNARPASPLKEKTLNLRTNSVSSPSLTQPLSAGGVVKGRRRARSGQKAVASQKRWV